MNKLQKTLAVLISSALMALPAVAVEFRVGISAGLAGIEATGTETLKDSSKKTTHNEDAVAVIPSFFTELAMDNGLGIGYDMVSGNASFDAKTKNNDNAALSAAVVGNDTGTNKASADVDGLDTIYLIKKFNSGLLIKFGKTTADVKTIETLNSGTVYGDKSVDGTTVGIGWETSNDSGLFVRTTVESTSFDSLKLTGSQAGGTTTSFNVIDADIDMTMAKISVGKVF